MITRDQIYTMLMVRKRENSFFNLPMELIVEISDYGQDPHSDIAKALYHAAYARQEDVAALIQMLDTNPRVLLEAGNVITPGGDEIRRVTLYEFLLGAGDYDLAEIVQRYFSQIENGEQERRRQYERYKPYIKGMLTQAPYDLAPLIELIKKATPKEIAALLNKDYTGDNDLCKAIIQFRKDWVPRILLKPCMHYNYASLQHAFKLLDDEWSNLYKESGHNFDKINLVWRQLIGFEMRRLPGIDRCVMAQGLYYVINEKQDVSRSYSLKNDARVAFLTMTVDDSLDGLGGDFAVDILGLAARGATYLSGSVGRALVGRLMSNKNFKLTELMQSHPAQQSSWCVVC